MGREFLEDYEDDELEELDFEFTFAKSFGEDYEEERDCTKDLGRERRERLMQQRRAWRNKFKKAKE